MKPRVLLVDDEPRVLEGYRRNLHRQFDLETAEGPMEGLATLEAATTGFAVVVSDLQMPEMDGITFLGKVHEAAPDTTRIMLTGQADLDASISAVNEGRVFRFLTKPCPAEVLAEAITAGAEQNRLRTAEKQLLEETLSGTVEVLVEVLGLASPTGHDQAARLRALVAVMREHVELEEDWELQLAVDLSQLGTITLSDETRRRLADGAELDPGEQQVVDAHPEAGHNLLARIPRLENVARMIRLQSHPVSDFPADVSESVTRGALMIGLAAHYDGAVTKGASHREALSLLRSERTDDLSSSFIDALEGWDGPTVSWQRNELSPVEVHSGMVVDEDLRAASGALLIRSGETITPALLERLRSYASGVGLEHDLIPVRVPKVDAAA